MTINLEKTLIKKGLEYFVNFELCKALNLLILLYVKYKSGWRGEIIRLNNKFELILILRKVGACKLITN